MPVPGIGFSISQSTQRFNVKVLVINNHGGGFADYVEVADGTTVRDMFQREVRSGKPDQYLIRVNRQPVPSDQILHDGDRISFTPVKIEGAIRPARPLLELGPHH
jgi:sulfur carrier protein ThiS